MWLRTVREARRRKEDWEWWPAAREQREMSGMPVEGWRRRARGGVRSSSGRPWEAMAEERKEGREVNRWNVKWKARRVGEGEEGNVWWEERMEAMVGLVRRRGRASMKPEMKAG